MSLIHLNDIKKTYTIGQDDYQALKGISFAVDKGEFIAIMGPSGSGKSTAMHILGCLDTPTSGKYILNEKDVSLMTDNELAKVRNEEIGFIFQAFNLLPRLSLFDNVMLPFAYNNTISDKEKIVRAMDAIEAVGLTDKIHNKSNQLSGGQIQRTAIARSLVMKPTIILADEPTGNLDSVTSHEVLNALQKINQSGNTVILVTHEENIAKYASRVIRLKDGLVISDKKQ